MVCSFRILLTKIMGNNKNKKGTKKVKPSDYDIPGTIRKIQLFPGESGIDKKKAKNYDYFSKDNDYPV